MNIFYSNKSSQILLRLTVVGSTLLLVACGQAGGQAELSAPLPEVGILPIQPGLQRSFETTGEVQASKSSTVLAEVAATITAIPVKLGDTVKQGQILATLEARDVEQRYRTATNIYSSALENLKQSEISGQRGVQEAEIALKQAQITYDKLLDENKARRRQAEEAVNAAKLNLQLSTNSAETTIDNAIRKTYTAIESALRSADNIFEYSDAQKTVGDYTTEIHLGVKDPSQKLTTENSLKSLSRDFTNADRNYENSLDLLNQTEAALRQAIITLNNSITSGDYTVSELNADLSTINTQITSVRSVISELQSAKSTYDSTAQRAGGTSQVVVDAQANYDTTIAQLEAAEEKARLDIERAQAVLDSARASADAGQISARTNYATAAGELQQARIDRDELTVVAPFEGTVTALPERVGADLTANAPVVTIENNELIKVVTSVSADEVKQLRIGDPVLVGGVESTIASLSPNADPQTKKFTIEIFLENSELQPGEFVTVRFLSKSEQAGSGAVVTIYVPVTSVHVSAADTFVWLAVDSGALVVTEKRPITIGDVSGKFVEVVEGLDPGDQVVTTGGRALEDEGMVIMTVSDQ